VKQAVAITPLDQVALAILAGGHGKRMGGPKDRLLARGRPMLHFLLDHLRWPGPVILVLGHGREPPAGSERVGRIVHDRVPDQGPLRGILTALEASPCEVTVVIPVDMPWLEHEHLAFVATHLLSRSDLVGVLPSRSSAGAARIESFPSAFRATAAPLIRSQIDRGDLAIRSLPACHGISIVPAPPTWPADVWRNLNAPGDLPDWIQLGM
jgi:molybdopterin-guanine dinucleotide biosynthesis protein A